MTGRKQVDYQVRGVSILDEVAVQEQIWDSERHLGEQQEIRNKFGQDGEKMNSIFEDKDFLAAIQSALDQSRLRVGKKQHQTTHMGDVHKWGKRRR